MYAAAFISIVIALYVSAFAFCKVAAEADAQASRYQRRVQQVRNNVISIRSFAAAGPSRLEALRGR